MSLPIDYFLPLLFVSYGFQSTLQAGPSGLAALLATTVQPLVPALVDGSIHPQTATAQSLNSPTKLHAYVVFIELLWSALDSLFFFLWRIFYYILTTGVVMLKRNVCNECILANPCPSHPPIHFQEERLQQDMQSTVHQVRILQLTQRIFW